MVLGYRQLPQWQRAIRHSKPILHQGTVDVLTETEFWQALGLVDQDHGARRLYTPAMLAELLRVPIKTIRRWHRRGLIKPTRRVHKLPYFDFQEVASARKIAELVSSGASQTVIEAKLKQLIDQFPDSQRPLSQLTIIAEGRDIRYAGDTNTNYNPANHIQVHAADELNIADRRIRL